MPPMKTFCVLDISINTNIMSIISVNLWRWIESGVPALAEDETLVPDTYVRTPLTSAGI